MVGCGEGVWCELRLADGDHLTLLVQTDPVFGIDFDWHLSANGRTYRAWHNA
jgi:hypothetical protein